MNEELVNGAAQYGSSMAAYVVIAAVFIVIGAIFIIAKLLGAMKALKQTVEDVQEAHVKEALEEQEKINQMTKLLAWMGNLQKDVVNTNVGNIIALEALEALVHHAIEVQGANGKCHDSRDAIKDYLHAKKLNMNSYDESDV